MILEEFEIDEPALITLEMETRGSGSIVTTSAPRINLHLLRRMNRFEKVGLQFI